MKTNLHSFMLGCLIGILPVALYANFKLGKPTQTPSYEFKYQNEGYISSHELVNSVSDDNKPETSTPTPSPTEKPIKITSTPIQNTEKQVVNTLTQTASIEIHNQVHSADIPNLIERYANEYGVNKDIMLIIARCESGLRPEAVNGPFAGIYQFLSSTWMSNRNAMGLDPDPGLRFNAEEAVKTAAFKMSRDGFGAWPACSQKAFNLLQLASVK